jgi:hypothetical protein
MVVHQQKKLNNMKVSIVSIFRDESKYLKEWIEFHLLVGVDKFYLVNNNSIDNFDEVLSPYILSGVVVLYNITTETKNNTPGFKNEQIIVKDWVKKMNEIVLSSDDDWVIHISTDEFLFPSEKNNIKDVLINYHDSVGEISVNWTMFGNNNFSLGKDDLLIEKLTKSSEPNHILNFHVKPIFKPKGITYIPSVHFGYLKHGFVKVDANGNPNNFRNGHEVIDRVYHPLHINHYRLRDLSWTESKLKMYELWGRNDLLDLSKSYNDIDNYNISRFVENLKTRMN